MVLYDQFDFVPYERRDMFDDEQLYFKKNVNDMIINFAWARWTYWRCRLHEKTKLYDNDER